jgi:hypothetical protein
MQLISDEYTKLNKELHDYKVHYGAIGMRHLNKVVKLIKEINTTDVLDYGCGKSTLARNLPFRIQQYDPAIEKYKSLPVPADVVVCTDVLEHVEPEFLENVLKHLAYLTKKAGYFTACTCPAKKTLSDGRNAHISLHTKFWWNEKFIEYFTIKELNFEDNEIVVIVLPKEAKLNDRNT